MPNQLPHGIAYPTDLLSQKSQEAAKHRRDLREQTRKGDLTLAELFNLVEQDRVLARTRIRTVLLWIPTFGNAKVGKVLGNACISPARRLTTLTANERSGLLADPRIVQHTAAVSHQRANEEAA
jgi:hypothetical protein